MGGGSMSETKAQVIGTRTAERTQVEKAATPIDGGAWWEIALTAEPETARAWLRSREAAELHVLGPWIGALADGEPERAVLVVRSREPLSPPSGFARFDPDAARGLVGVFA